jgi:hypothetical protein
VVSEAVAQSGLSAERISIPELIAPLHHSGSVSEPGSSVFSLTRTPVQVREKKPLSHKDTGFPPKSAAGMTI